MAKTPTGEMENAVHSIGTAFIHCVPRTPSMIMGRITWTLNNYINRFMTKFLSQAKNSI